MLRKQRRSESLSSVELTTVVASPGHPGRRHHRQELQGGEQDHVALRPHRRQELGGQLGLQSSEHRLQRADPQTGLHHQLHHVSRVLLCPGSPRHQVLTPFCHRNVNGIVFVGSVKEKTVARNLYAQARARGKAAGIVRLEAACQLGPLRSSQLKPSAPPGPTLWTWRRSRPRSTFLRAATSTLSSTTRR